MSRCPGLVRAGPPAAGRGRRTAGGPWSTALHGSDRRRGQAAPRPDSCDSTGPPVTCSARGRFVPCWWARLMVESTLTSQSINPAVSASASRVCQDLVPGAVPGEAAVPLPHGLPRPELLRHVPPRHPGAVPVDDPVDHLPMITKRLAPLPIRGRHQRRDPRPLRVGQGPSARHGPNNHRQPRATYGDTP